MNDSSREVIHSILGLNEAHGSFVAGYTFDAGPNANVFTLEKFVPEVKKVLGEIEGVKKIVVLKAGFGPKFLKDGHLISETGDVREFFFDEKKGVVVK